MNKISEELNKENIIATEKLNSNNINNIYEKLKIWSDSNGSIYSNNVEFPVAYGPFGYVGIKAKRDIDKNEAIIFIPRKQMIISSDYKEKFSFLFKNDKNNKDKSHIILTLFLLLEEQKGDASFYKPYLNMLPKVDFPLFWDNISISELDDETIRDSINVLRNDIDESYKEIIIQKEFENIPKSKFIYYYCQVQSRQFFLDDQTSALVPLVELLNHNIVNTKYEFYDSENFVFKYTNELCDNSIKNTQPTKALNFPFTDITYEPTDAIQCKDHNEIYIKPNDFFVFATTNNQKFTKGEQIYLNYSRMANKSCLIHYGFNLLINKYDSTLIYFKFKKENNEFVKYMTTSFNKKFQTDSFNGFYSLKIKIQFKSICDSLIKFYRFMRFWNLGQIENYYLYKFNHSIEYDVISNSIDELKKRLNEMNGRYQMENDLQYLEKGILNKTLTERQMNIAIYRIRKRINIAHQIELLKIIISIMDKVNLNHYKEITKYINEKNININSQYESINNCIHKLIKFSFLDSH